MSTNSSSNETVAVNGTPLNNNNIIPQSSPSPSPTVSPVIPEQNNKKYSKNVIEVVGLDSCGHCADTEMYIKSEVTPNSDVPVEYKKYDANSPEGRLIVEDKKLTHVPYIKQCLIPTDPQKQPECTEIKEFKKDFFKIKVNG